jgi:ribonuclease Z
MVRTVGALQHLVLDIVPGQRIGYVTDLRYTGRNVETLSRLLAGVDLLFIESVFLDEDAEHGARKNHLTARQAGEIARVVGAGKVMPFHFSPRYEDRSRELLAEVEAAWSARMPPLGKGSDRR